VVSYSHYCLIEHVMRYLFLQVHAVNIAQICTATTMGGAREKAGLNSVTARMGMMP
jgi:hypothetical protein